MAFEEQVVQISIPAGADLSAIQFQGVKLNSTGQAIVVASAQEVFIGFLQNKPDAAGKAALVAVAGRAKVKAGAAVTIGDVLEADSTGRVIKATALTLNEASPNTLNNWPAACGIAMSAAGAAGDIIDALIQLPISAPTKDLTAQ